MNQKPNILWICTDQQRFDSLACYGNKDIDTPNIDKLANKGILFKNAYCQAPVCSPSRGSFLTGKYPRTVRLRQNGQEIPSETVLITKKLKELSGYYNGLSGKLHISACNPDVIEKEKRIDDGYDEFYWSHGSPHMSKHNQYNIWLNEINRKYEVYSYKGSPYVETGMEEENTQAYFCAQKAIEFIERRSQDSTPWLFSVNIFDPHHPFDPPLNLLEKYFEKMDSFDLPDYKEGELLDRPYFQSKPIECKYHYNDMSDYDHRLIKAAYYAMIENIDKQVGRMIDCLEKNDLIENTIIIFTSDHGENLGDHRIYLKGPYFYECAVKVPLIISMPGTFVEGVKAEALVELLDIFDTLMDATGNIENSNSNGKSFLDILLGKASPDYHKDTVYCEYYNALRCHVNPSAYATMVRYLNYKIVIVHDLEQGELYDLENDPKEHNNLFYNKEYLDVKCMMLQKACDKMAFTIDPFPERICMW